MTQAQGERRDVAFDGRIQLNGEAAPELEVIVELTDQYVVLAHISGELGRWEKSRVHVAPIGRGWFTIDVEDEQVTFLPRRPGHFAAVTLDLVPVEETKKRFGRKAPDKKAEKAQAPSLSRKERKQLRRAEARATVAPAQPVEEPGAPTAPPVAPVSEPPPAPRPVEATPTPAPVEPVPPPSGHPPSQAPVPEVEPASPWDDLPLPDIRGRKPRDGRRSPGVSYAPSRSAPAERSRPVREKAPQPPREKTPRPSRGERAKPAGSPTVEPAGLPRKSALNRGLAGFRHGLKGIAYRISDELRQTGIVPFDRLPAAPARARASENHEHVFQEHRLPGGLTRNVCHSCGLVSIGESADD